MFTTAHQLTVIASQEWNHMSLAQDALVSFSRQYVTILSPPLPIKKKSCTLPSSKFLPGQFFFAF